MLPFVFDHFISEIADCTQQQKIPAPAAPFQRPASAAYPYPGTLSLLQKWIPLGTL